MSQGDGEGGLVARLVKVREGLPGIRRLELGGCQPAGIQERNGQYSQWIFEYEPARIQEIHEWWGTGLDKHMVVVLWLWPKRYEAMRTQKLDWHCSHFIRSPQQLRHINLHDYVSNLIPIYFIQLELPFDEPIVEAHNNNPNKVCIIGSLRGEYT